MICTINCVDFEVHVSFLGSMLYKEQWTANGGIAISSGDNFLKLEEEES